MNDFEGLLASDYGFKPQGKSAPMSASKPSNSSSSSSSNLNFDRESIFTTTAGSHKPHRSNDFSDIFGGPTRKSEANSFNFDSVFRESGSGISSSTSGGPVFDKPVYDDDIFDGVPGLKSSSSKAKYEDVFPSAAASSLSPKGRKNDAFDDLLGGFGKAEPQSKGFSVKKSHRESDSFDDLIPGFGGGATAHSERPTSEANWSSEPTVSAAKMTSNVMEDPFKVLESTSRPVVSSPDHFADPLEEISNLNNSGRTKSDGSFVGNGGVYDDIDPFDGLGKSVPAFSSDRNDRGKDKSPSRTDSTSWNRTSSSKESTERTSVRSPESRSQKKMPVESDQESHQTLFDMPAFSADSHKSFGQTTSPRSYVNSSSNEANVQVDISPTSEENLESSDDVWLTVSEIPLFTQPTSAPPPSRPPPPRPVQVSKATGSGSPAYANSRKKMNEHNSFQNSARQFQGPKSAPYAARDSVASPFDDLEDFSVGRSQNNVDGHANGLSGEEFEMNSVAAAMKEAMDRAEAKFRQAKEVRERESTKSTRSKDSVQLEKDEKTMQEERVQREEKQERLDRERLHREREEEERELKRLEREREEKEREQRRLEKEKERAREIERERARQAVERATREARERAANDARLRAEKAAVGKANAEARERAERAAVQRAQAEARERAAADAKERAEKAAAEARERTNAESKDRVAAAAQARQRAERAAVERAASEARERAAAASRMNQQKNESDLESFFSMGARPSSAPRPRASSSNKQEPEVAKKSTTNSSNIRKANSTTNIVDDLSSIFGAAPSSSGDFQDVEGESEERRRARLERHHRTQERAAKALAEKNQRDLQTQWDQAERHRIAETLDVEIKRWSAGKEGNLRALLSTLQYVLWPECGWQPVSLTDLINGASVKKVYRKATLCIHPDKVQQKGANLQQKYIAEKVFDLLKEAWNKFNSEELF